jgi:hypothetical protein
MEVQVLSFAPELLGFSELLNQRMLTVERLANCNGVGCLLKYRST